MPKITTDEECEAVGNMADLAFIGVVLAYIGCLLNVLTIVCAVIIHRQVTYVIIYLPMYLKNQHKYL